MFYECPESDIIVVGPLPQFSPTITVSAAYNLFIALPNVNPCEILLRADASIMTIAGSKLERNLTVP